MSLLHKTKIFPFLLLPSQFLNLSYSPRFLPSTCLSLFSLLLPSGFLQITPEGSPQAQRKGELGGEADVLGSFCLHSSGLDLTTQEMSEEHQVSSSEEGTVTMVTKTTKITQRIVSTETRTGETSVSTTTTQQVSDFNY